MYIATLSTCQPSLTTVSPLTGEAEIGFPFTLDLLVVRQLADGLSAALPCTSSKFKGWLPVCAEDFAALLAKFTGQPLALYLGDGWLLGAGRHHAGVIVAGKKYFIPRSHVYAGSDALNRAAVNLRRARELRLEASTIWRKDFALLQLNNRYFVYLKEG